MTDLDQVLEAEPETWVHVQVTDEGVLSEKL